MARARKATQVGDVIRETREQLGISQGALAKAAGMDPAHLSHLEAGRRLNPRFETIAVLASALGVSLDEIAARCGLAAAGTGSGSAPSDRSRQLQARQRLQEAGRLLDRAKALYDETEEIVTGAPTARKRKT